MKRDREICGVHIGGCGQKLPTKKSATRDHIISQSFISFMPAERKVDFNRDWNIQPMCPKCNSEVRVGQMNNWPLFKCRCHYLQIGEDEGMYIHERTKARDRKHLMLAGAVGNGTIMRLFSSRLPGAGTMIGWSRDTKTRGGHLLVPMPAKSVPSFNWFELARIGEANGQRVLGGRNGERCTYLPNGTIIPGSSHWCTRWFPIDIGHHNLGHNPFKPADRKTDEYLQNLRSSGMA